MIRPLQSIRCPKCLKKEVFIASNIKDSSKEDKYAYGKCGRCGWYGKLKNALKE